jgi:FtsH-binding integral membrane protein
MSVTTAPVIVDAAAPSARADFIRRTYGHLALAILAFTVVEWLLLQWSGARELAARMTDGYVWLLVLIAFGAISSFANRWASTPGSVGKQYLGLAIAVVAQALLFLPLLLGVTNASDDTVLPTAALITLLLVAGLTAVVVVTRNDFSFLRTGLIVGGFVSFGLIAASILIGFDLGVLFAFAMVAFAAASVLYSTGGVLHRFRTDQHVAASLSLFASVALLFWYVIRIVQSNRR